MFPSVLACFHPLSIQGPGVGVSKLSMTHQPTLGPPMGIYTPVIIESKHTVFINMEDVTEGRLACPSRF